MSNFIPSLTMILQVYPQNHRRNADEIFPREDKEKKDLPPLPAASNTGHLYSQFFHWVERSAMARWQTESEETTHKRCQQNI